MSIEVVGIENDDDSIGTLYARHVALQHIDGYPLVFRLRNQAVNTGQIDKGDFVAIGGPRMARVTRGMLVDPAILPEKLPAHAALRVAGQAPQSGQSWVGFERCALRSDAPS